MEGSVGRGWGRILEWEDVGVGGDSSGGGL